MRGTVLVVLAACGGGAVAPDAAPPDAGSFALPTCPVAYDGVYIVSETSVLPIGQGRDLDGDGDVDNLIGLLASTINRFYEDALAAGVTNLFVMPGLAVPPRDEPVEITAFMPSASDADDPPDPTNNFVDGEFLLSLATLDTACQPLTPIAMVQDGTTLTGVAERIEVQAIGGRSEIRRILMDGTVTEDGSRLVVDSAGMFTSCGLDKTSFPGPTPGSALGGLVAAGLQPDIDDDGDGLERLVLDGNVIAACIDGDGTTIPGAGCPCDPAIVDGYSAAFHTEAVPGRIVGMQ